MEHTNIQTIRGEWSLREGIGRLRVKWCRTMHGDITWPHHGHYRCKSCGREYAVPWGPESRWTSAPVIPITRLEHARTA